MSLYDIPLSIIRDNPWQTRLAIDPDHVAELAADIKRNGLLQPAVGRVVFDTAAEFRILSTDDVKKLNETDMLGSQRGIYVQLALGHNRRAAFGVLAADEPDKYGRLPIQIGYYTDEQMAKMAWSENEQRLDLSPLEEAQAIQKAMTDFGWSQAAAGENFGLGRATVANKLRLLKLPSEVREQLHSGQISARQASAMLPLYSLPESALSWAEDIHSRLPE
ncbi:MAG: ParB/RepB/Spo0J family partition protein [Chloroflexota bacterium]